MDITSRFSSLKLPTEPYPGLRPFLDHESALLLGRGRQVREVIERLRETHFVAVIGGSGSGKSSLIRAGVVPELRGLGIPDAGDYWIPVICTPGTTATSRHETMMYDQSGLAAQTPITRLAWKFAQALDPAEEVLKRIIANRKLKARNAKEELEEPEELKTPIDPDVAAAKRRSEIATVFRQGAGFSRLAKTYFDELPAVGPDQQSARFLFVIDQFEELFHPNNRENDDAKTLVEAVIEHFFSSDPKCFVVLTMRSEHLADCAAYLELPDAINKSFYLVRRLDELELREAIVGPAKYFLRLCQRSRNAQHGTLPEDVVFDESVIDRLLRDVAQIASDADHLPLLQHVLARTWECACARELQLPAQIVWQDLEKAVDPGSERAPGWLHGQETINTLRSSLDNWAQTAYRKRSAEQRRQIDVVLRQLAFKDPNNGLYSQQRVDVDDPDLFPGVAQPRQMLRDLLAHGFLDSVNYLFWDTENPERVTLKVSHESFIRGWTHFRMLVDTEAERFEEFIAVLRRCATWAAEQDPELLLEASELSRLEAFNLVPVFEDPDERQDWFRVLLQYRDGERLARVESQVDAFVEASRDRQQAREQTERDRVERQRQAEERQRLAEERERLAVAQGLATDAERRQQEAETARFKAEAETADVEAQRERAVGIRNKLLAFSAIGVAVILGGYAAFAAFIQTPAMYGIEKLSTARALAERRERTADVYTFIGAANEDLGVLLRAANLVGEARKGQSLPLLGNSVDLRHTFEWLPPVAYSSKLFELSSSEPVVNGNLRKLLNSVVWQSSTDASKVDALPRNVEAIECLVRTEDNARDQSGPAADAGRTSQAAGQSLKKGALYRGSEAGRGIFVPDSHVRESELQLFDATVKDKSCTAGEIAWSVPSYLDPYILFDSGTSFMAVASGELSTRQPYVQLYSISWGPSQDGREVVAKVSYRSVVTAPEAVKLVLDELDPEGRRQKAVWSVPRVKSVKSWREQGGTGVEVAKGTWRLFSDAAQPLDDIRDDSRDWAALQQAEGSCRQLGEVLAANVQPGFRSTVFQDDRLCFEIQRGNPEGMAQGPASQTEQVLVAVYNSPLPADSAQPNEARPAAIASVANFGRFAVGPHAWFVGKSGPYEGWIALRQELPDQKEPVYSGVPWSTPALLRLGCAVYRTPAQNSSMPDSTARPLPACPSPAMPR